MFYNLFSNLIYLTTFNVITNTRLVFGIRNESKYQHNQQELEATRYIKIGQDKCQNNTIQVFVHSAATISGRYFQRRQASRETWVKDAIKNKFRVSFVLGLPKNASYQNQIIAESDKYGDILQFGFVDDYHNLTLKAIAILGWSSANCLVNDYIIKTDDDILVNTIRLRENIDNKVFNSGFTGKMFENSKPVRDINDKDANKWFVPKEIYDRDVYPPYLSGAAYVMSTDVIEKLYVSAINNTGPVLDIDDLYLTGLIADKYNIGVHNSPEFVLTGSVDKEFNGINICKLHIISTLHGFKSVNQTIDVWTSWKNSSIDFCNNFLNKREKPTTSGRIALIIAIALLITFILSILTMIIQYFSTNKYWKFEKINS